MFFFIGIFPNKYLNNKTIRTNNLLKSNSIHINTVSCHFVIRKFQKSNYETAQATFCLRTTAGFIKTVPSVYIVLSFKKHYLSLSAQIAEGTILGNTRYPKSVA